VQLDNARELSGWGPAARTLSRVIRLSLRFGVGPVFIPEGEPQFNGSVENFNGWFQPRVRPANRVAAAGMRGCNAVGRTDTLLEHGLSIGGGRRSRPREKVPRGRGLGSPLVCVPSIRVSRSLGASRRWLRRRLLCGPAAIGDQLEKEVIADR